MGPLPVVLIDERVSERHPTGMSLRERIVANVRMSIRRSCVAAGERSFRN
jgi:hypothetical protein